MQTFQIQLSELKFYAYHGLYEEEKKLGAWFRVDVEMECITNSNQINDLSQTVDYGAVLAIIRNRMQKPTELLETICTDLANEILMNFKSVVKINVCISKLHPPIEAMQGYVKVCIEKLNTSVK